MVAKRMGVLVLHEGVDQYLEELRRRFPAVEFQPIRQPAGLEALSGFPAAIAYSCVTDGFPRTEHARLRDWPGLDWVHVGGSGFDHFVADGPPGMLSQRPAVLRAHRRRHQPHHKRGHVRHRLLPGEPRCDHG
ncbi:MAG: hypothetical protein KDH20_05955, partial [Rhodocyclaceae bacterium]|nr:hypothetical protein [Rhodocyclaceae bacterium]